MGGYSVAQREQVEFFIDLPVVVLVVVAAAVDKAVAAVAAATEWIPPSP